MPRPGGVTNLNMATLLAHGSLRAVKQLYVAPESALVNGVVLVSQLEAIRRIPPNTVVVLSPDMGSGGWKVSAALRQAWERKASAVIVPENAYAASAVGLAERLGISLLAADPDPSRVALALAAEIGAMKSVVDVELAGFARAVAAESTVNNVLGTISHRLGAVHVSLEQDGIVLASTGAAGGEVTAVGIAIRSIDPAVPATLVARVPKTGGYDPVVVRTFLEVAAPSVQAAWLASEISENEASTPSFALAEMDRPRLVDAPGTADSFPGLLARLGWRDEQPYEAVWIAHDPREPHRAGRTAIVRLLWRKVAPHRPLAEVGGGWLAIVPGPAEEEPSRLEQRLREKIGASMTELGLSAGVSRRQTGALQLPAIVQEARIAAECARRLDEGSVASFAKLGIGAASVLVDDGAIAEVARLALPALLAAPDCGQIVRDALAFMDHQNSVTMAANSLDVHRNTMQARLNRAKDVGISLNDPSQLLSTHLIMRVLERTFLNNKPGKELPKD